MRRILAALLATLFVLSVSPGFAQGMLSVVEKAQSTESDAQSASASEATADQRLQTMIDQARANGTPFIVMPIDASGQPATEASAADTNPIGQAVVVRNAMRNTFAALPVAGSEIGEALVTASETEGAGWLWQGILLAIFGVAVGLVARALVRRRAFRSIARSGLDPAKDRVNLVSIVMLRLLARFVALFCFALAGFLAITVLIPFTDPRGWTAHVVIFGLTAYFFLRDVFTTIYAPDAPEARMPNLTDEEARRLLRPFLIIAGIGLTLLSLSTWLHGLGLDPRVSDLVHLVATLTVGLLLVIYVIAERKTVAKIIRGHSPEPSRWRKFVASTWHLFVAAYLILGVLHNAQMIVTTTGTRVGPILSPILGALAGFIAYAIALIVIDRRVRARQEELYRASAGTARGVGPDGELVETLAPDEPAEPTAVDAAAEAPAPAEPADDNGDDGIEPITRWQLRWKAFADKIAAMTALLVAIVVTAAVSGNLKLHTEAGEWVGIAVILYVTYVVYHGLKTWIDGKMEEEEGPAAGGHSEDGMGPGSSRLGTLLPLLRNVLVVVAFAMAGTFLLAGMGVNVAPLFAGAGIIGLAVGFGAQSLIRDIFSGAFFLFDDAFRRGEYLDVGSVMGSVEKISVRSFQLRHHNGPLHTIPFGEIKQLTNFSRDWVIMKLKLRLVYGTDIEKVRKLVKKLGQQMAADPEIGHLFLDPLKSQGVVEMEDSAMICRVKFMTKPGDQFLARRHVYTSIHNLFEKEGIQFASRQVTVRVAGAQPGDDITPALGAVAPVVSGDGEQK
ncbi:MAG: hypothetical protein AcusKO_21340 [Acuticoccus sp.]